MAFCAYLFAKCIFIGGQVWTVYGKSWEKMDSTIGMKMSNFDKFAQRDFGKLLFFGNYNN